LIVCPNCSRDNEDHYKFCLGCGTELARAPRPVAPTVLPQAVPIKLPGLNPLGAHAPAVDLPRSVKPTLIDASGPRFDPEPTPATHSVDPTPAVDPVPPVHDVAPPVVLSASDGDELPFDLSTDGEAPHGAVAAAAAAAALSVAATATTEAPEPVPAPTSAADALPFEPATEDGLTVAHAPLTEAERETAEASTAVVGAALYDAMVTTPEDARLCSTCGTAVPEGFKFCGVCGGRYDGRSRAPAAAPFVPPAVEVTPAPAQLVVIHPDGSEGATFPLNATETTVGRAHPSPLFADDPFLSPRHATFYFGKNQLFARDEGSLNGIFIRIKAEVELFHGDLFRIGQQLLRFEELAQVRPVLPGAGDGTMVMGSPVRGAWGRLSSVVAINTPASVWVLRRAEEGLGRERGEITFPDDGFVSGAHCKVVTRDGRFFLQDTGSTNGTYLRVKAEAILSQGDLVLLGQQLFRVDLKT